MKLTHLDEQGNAAMVDVTQKAVTQRRAVAGGRIAMNRACFDAVAAGSVKKGDVFAVARVAGIMAAKRASELIPLCHGLSLTQCGVEFIPLPESSAIEVSCAVCCEGKTGVEMEALTGATVALLTIYDMCKALDKRMVISDVRLVEKQGGKSGHFMFKED